ncbi:MAG: hypothetical protein N3G20_03260, partial [Verrucomicrobiae bacterium]|nr:hypothetical protein [Verrucomicrobiae bacterium]
VAVPVVFVSWFRRILFVGEHTHCFCNHAPGIARFTDETELAALVAPRPVLFICATGDWTRDFPKEEFPEIKHIYQLVGGEASCVQFDKPHNYDRDSRERMYAWMIKHLVNGHWQERIQEDDIALEHPAALRELGLTPEGLADTRGASDYFRKKYSFDQVLRETDRGPARGRLPTKRDLWNLLGECGPPVPLAAESRGMINLAGFDTEKILVETEPDVRVPVWIFNPGGPSFDRGRAAIILLHPKGKRALLEERAGLVRELLNAGVVVVAPDVRLRGELHRNWDWNCVIWGRPEIGMGAHDLACIAVNLRLRRGIDPKRVTTVGLGETGATALFGAVLDDQLAGVAIEQMGPLLAEISGPKVPAGILRYGDLPQFAALIAPRPLWINGDGGRFGFTEERYANLRSSAFRRSNLDQKTFEKELILW